MLKHSVYLILAISVGLLFLGVLSCHPDTSLYIREGVGHFYIDLPPGYSVTQIDNREDHGYTDISISGPWNKEKQTYAKVSIFVSESDAEYPDASTMIERTINFVDDWPEYKLLERKDFFLGDIPAERFSYQYVGYHEVHPRPDAIATAAISTEVVFDHGGKIWTIRLNSRDITYDENLIIFEQILNSFRILD